MHLKSASTLTLIVFLSLFPRCLLNPRCVCVCFTCVCVSTYVWSPELSFDLCGVECQACLIALGSAEEDTACHRAPMKAPQQWILHFHYPSTPTTLLNPWHLSVRGSAFPQGGRLGVGLPAKNWPGEMRERLLFENWWMPREEAVLFWRRWWCEMFSVEAYSLYAVAHWPNAKLQLCDAAQFTVYDSPASPTFIPLFSLYHSLSFSLFSSLS